MIVRWNEVLSVPNDISESDGRPCECGKKVSQETLEMYAISDGRVMTVKKIQSSGNTVRIWLDA